MYVLYKFKVSRDVVGVFRRCVMMNNLLNTRTDLQPDLRILCEAESELVMLADPQRGTWVVNTGWQRGRRWRMLALQAYRPWHSDNRRLTRKEKKNRLLVYIVSSIYHLLAKQYYYITKDLLPHVSVWLYENDSRFQGGNRRGTRMQTHPTNIPVVPKFKGTARNWFSFGIIYNKVKWNFKLTNIYFSGNKII